MPPFHAASRAAMAVDDHLGAPTVAADAAATLQTLHVDLTQNKSPCRRAARLRLPSPLSRPNHPSPPPRGAALQAPRPSPHGGVSIARSHVHGTAVCGASAWGGRS